MAFYDYTDTCKRSVSLCISSSQSNNSKLSNCASVEKDIGHDRIKDDSYFSYHKRRDMTRFFYYSSTFLLCKCS